MWCAAIICFAFSFLLILAGLVIIIVFRAVKPMTLSFNITNAAHNSIYIDFNGDMTLMANISNPNHKISVVIQSGAVELFFRGRLVSIQSGAVELFFRGRLVSEQALPHSDGGSSQSSTSTCCLARCCYRRRWLGSC
ncbi:hypothetical protein ZWY2020_043133 [Hordeum vulgare]|nr:hypothetical protein ZWY2020_043133 [Hordeum vulgare]